MMVSMERVWCLSLYSSVLQLTEPDHNALHASNAGFTFAKKVHDHLTVGKHKKHIIAHN